MKPKIILLVSLIACLFIADMPLSAQKKSKDNGGAKQLENVKRRDLRNFGTVIENDVTVGYYMFSKIENTGGGMASFKIEIFDENLKSKKTIKIEKRKTAQLVEMNYNGKAFFIMMTNKKGIDMMTFDKEGKKLGELNIKKVSKWERMRIQQAVMSEEASSTSIYSASDEGFIRQAFVKNKKLGFVIERYDNKLKLQWSYGSDKASKRIEAADILYSSENYVAVLKEDKKKLISRDIDVHFVLLNASKGTKLFELQLKELADLSLLGCDVDETKQQIILNGEYYAKGKKIYNSKSEGIYLKMLDLKGKELKMQKLSWKKDLVSLNVTDEEKGKSKENMRFYIHKVVIAANGNTYVVAEQYKKILSATAVGMKLASAALGGGGNSNLSSFSIKMYNMVYMVFDNSFNLVEKQVVKKKFSEIWLDKSQEYTSATVLAHYLKANGYFDYQFTSLNKEKGGFTTYYLDLNRKGTDGKKNDAVIGTISLSEDKIETKRTPINTQYSYMFICPAKENNVLIGEHWRSKKKMFLRIEPIE
ncbi:MAG: hypothetical protein PSX81_08505 [bacterium]|nr:hypothetical protein [bacterium]